MHMHMQGQAAMMGQGQTAMVNAGHTGMFNQPMGMDRHEPLRFPSQGCFRPLRFSTMKPGRR